MKLKTDYFIDIMQELGINSLYQYLKDSRDNFVICIGDVPYMDRNGIPYVYGGLTDVTNAVDEVSNNASFTTEFHFIEMYCMDAIEKQIINLILNNEATEYDGNNYLYYFPKTFCEEIDIDGMTDIVTAFAKNNMLEFLISNDDDTKQSYINLNSLDFYTIMNIIYQIEKG